jgi:hypothetical protein
MDAMAPGFALAVPGSAAGGYAGGEFGANVGKVIDQKRGTVKTDVVVRNKRLVERAMQRMEAPERDTTAEMGVIGRRNAERRKAIQQGFERRAADWWETTRGFTPSPDKFQNTLVEQTGLKPREIDEALEMMSRTKPKGEVEGLTSDGRMVSKQEIAAIRNGRSRELFSDQRGLEITQHLRRYAEEVRYSREMDAVNARIEAEQRRMLEARKRKDAAAEAAADRERQRASAEARRLRHDAQSRDLQYREREARIEVHKARADAVREKGSADREALLAKAEATMRTADSRAEVDAARAEVARLTGEARAEAARMAAEGRAGVDAERADAVRFKAEADVDKRLAETEAVRSGSSRRPDPENVTVNINGGGGEGGGQRLDGVRNERRYNQVMDNIRAEINLAQETAPSPEMRRLVLDVAQARTSTQKKALLAQARMEPELAQYADWIDLYVVPLTNHNPKDRT